MSRILPRGRSCLCGRRPPSILCPPVAYAFTLGYFVQYNLQQFERDFMARTTRLLAEFTGENDATMLLNCMIGLLIGPRERLLRIVPDEPLSRPEDWGIPQGSILCVERGAGADVTARSLRWLIIRLRNAVAHFHVLPVHDAAKVKGFELWDKTGFRVTLTLESIKTFVARLSQTLHAEWCRPVEKPLGRASWMKGAKLFTRAPTERVYIIDCPELLRRQCYEIASSAAEFYVAGSTEDIPSEGATDTIIEPEPDARRARILQLAKALSTELSREKRLSIYTNDDALIQTVNAKLASSAKGRLAFFGIFRIEEKRPSLRRPPAAA